MATADTTRMEGNGPTRDHGANPSDGAMGMAIVKGVGVGVPVVFVILFVIDLVAGLDPAMAALGAALPAGIFGGFIGGAVFIGRASDAANRPTADH